MIDPSIPTLAFVFKTGDVIRALVGMTLLCADVLFDFFWNFTIDQTLRGSDSGISAYGQFPDACRMPRRERREDPRVHCAMRSRLGMGIGS